MIYDQLSNVARYSLIPHLDAIQEFLKRKDILELKDPEISILGKDLFVRVIKTPLKKSAENSFETHQCHSDLQVVLKGTELMQVTNGSALTSKTEYDAKGDYQFFHDGNAAMDVIVREREFAFFFPGEAHKPGCLPFDGASDVYKLVFKIRMA